MSMNIVLVYPEIPQNTGNIARTCAATGAVLHLIEPLGFSLEDRYLKRAGLDYWPMMTYHTYPSLEDFFKKHQGERMFFASTKAVHVYSSVTYRDGDFIFFGQETRGLPENLLEKQYDHCIRIPMMPDARSLNLSNSVAIVLYEALRQMDFPGLKDEGALTGRDEAAAPWLDYV
ncbi:MAG: tRNA (uridine(34)/cytosine(34)/5-carboxymethylaminomethyluridine(34)-2'-O)-methyltransferase TrmL [Clostridia bacterium]|nr:tRNA (uridine(34)/cytosine(34)/5-carboxymethylaminomethyluridine(34)-2'-O)-methyltransferase TrmL [Clostridia bacterium]